MLTMIRHCNKKIFVQFVDNVQIKQEGSGKFKDKKVTISINYECRHFKEMMNIVQMIKNEGGEYVLKGSDSDVFVKYEVYHEDGTLWKCKREEYADIAINEGKDIKKISFEEFLAILGITNEKLEMMPLPSIDCLFREGAIIKNKKI